MAIRDDDGARVRQRRMTESFYCRARRRRLTLAKCLDDYMNANALERRKSSCFRCAQGRGNREEFSGEESA